MQERRIGKFYVSEDMIENEDFYPILMEMKFIPYRVEHLFSRQGFEYIGYSPLFDNLISGHEIPNYQIIINKSEDGTLKVEVERE